jgi:predicted metal-dependent peptidase
MLTKGNIMSDQQIDRDAETMRRVMNARAELIVKRRFYAVLVSNVEPVVSNKVPTMATDGRRHYCNPDFILPLTPKQMLGLQAHESEHDARRHSTRRNGRDPKEWNIACDLAINIDLIDEGFELPPDGYIDAKYRGMSAEDIYRMRELERRPPPPPPPQPGESDDDDKDDSDDDNADSDPGDDAADDDTSDDGDTESDAGESDDDSDSESDGDDEAASDDDSDAGDDADSGDGKGDDGEADTDAGNGSGEGDGETGDAGKGGGGDAGSSDDDDAPMTGASGDPRSWGDVLDATDDEGNPADGGDIAAQDAEWDRIVRIAASMAKAVGELPGHVSREIERANNPPRDWRDELREFCEEGALRIETWNRPNRRFAHSGLILPSSQKDGINKAVFLIDTSGSMDDRALACINVEAQAMLDDGIIDHVVVVYGDTRVTRVDEYTTGDQMEFDPRGGGGTDMKPLFAYAAEFHDDASCIINFTDLHIGDAGPLPACPVLFAVYGSNSVAVASLIERAPWGARGIDVGVY